MDFRTFWRGKLRLRKQTGQSAAQFGYGMSATGTLASSDEEDEAQRQFEESIQQFGQAHAATQQTIENLTATNSKIDAIDQKFNALSQMVCLMTQQAKQAPPPVQMQPFYYPAQQQQQQQPNQRNNYRGKKSYNNNNRNYGQGNQYQGTKPQTQPNPIKRYEGWKYCHTHGGDTDHNSWECQKPGENHNFQTTRQNYMQLSGNRKGMHKTILPSQAGRQGRQSKYVRNGQQVPQQGMQLPIAGAQMPMQAPFTMPMQMPVNIPMQMPMQAPQQQQANYMQMMPQMYNQQFQGGFGGFGGTM
jgi:hypothetical protein